MGTHYCKIKPCKCYFFLVTLRPTNNYNNNDVNYGDARGVMVIVVGNEHGDTSPILDEADCISHSTNTFGKGMNPIILPPAMGK